MSYQLNPLVWVGSMGHPTLGLRGGEAPEYSTNGILVLSKFTSIGPLEIVLSWMRNPIGGASWLNYLVRSSLKSNGFANDEPYSYLQSFDLNSTTIVTKLSIGKSFTVDCYVQRSHFLRIYEFVTIRYNSDI